MQGNGAVMEGARRTEVIGDCTLYLGESLEIMPHIRGVDIVLTDPPYNFSTASAGGKLNLWGDAVNSSFWFSAVFGAYVNAIGPTRSGIIWQFLNWKTFIPLQKAVWDAGLKFDSLMVWDKQWIGPGGSVGLRPSYELVALIAVGDASLVNRGLPDIWRCQWASQRPSGHPAEKPVDLFERIVKESPGNIVMDPFMGSGTAGVAAVKAGRKFIGIEIDEKWFDVACERIADATSRPDMFIERHAAATQEALL
jgi:site-specific DNA-methyltransferase (adenine-specific)